nr:serine protease [[Mycoplasma] imitans]
MKIKKIASLVSLGITSAVIPIPFILNTHNTNGFNDNKLTKKADYRLINNSLGTNEQPSSANDAVITQLHQPLYDFENNDYYEGFITFKDKISVYDRNSILEVIKEQPQVLDARKSKVISDYYLVTFFFKKGSDDKEKFDQFLNSYDLIGDFYLKENDQARETVEQANSQLKYDNIKNLVQEKIQNRYGFNFASNGYTDDERLQAINYTRNQIKYNNQKRIGVAVLEVGEEDNSRNALIDATDSYYFDKKTTNVWNRWDLFWEEFLFKSPKYGNILQK